MPDRYTLRALVAVALLCGSALSQQSPDTLDVLALKQGYESWLASLDREGFARGHATAVKQLASRDPQAVIRALEVLGATQDPAAVPWIVPFLDSDDPQLVIHAGLRLSSIVAAYPYKRLVSYPDQVVTLSPKTDLRPLAWVIQKMLTLPDDGNTHAYACTMAGNLGLSRLAGRVADCLRSRHPAVSGAAQHALLLLGDSQAFSGPELEAAERTAQAFARLFQDRDEDGLGRLLVPRDRLTDVFSADLLQTDDLDNLYLALVEGNMARFLEFRALCGDLEAMAVSFQPGSPARSDQLAEGVRMLKNSSLLLSYSQRVETTVKIEEMVLLGDHWYILKLD